MHEHTEAIDGAQSACVGGTKQRGRVVDEIVDHGRRREMGQYPHTDSHLIAVQAG